MTQSVQHNPATRSLTGCIAILLGMVPVASYAQQPLKTILVDVDHRPATSLDGDWHYLIDQYGRGLYTLDGKVRDDGFARNQHPVIQGPRNGFEEYDFATAPSLHVPQDWNTQDKSIFRYEGVVWYEKDFTHYARPGTRTFLHVGAANYRSHVWVNRKRICDHEGGYTPFDCEVTAALVDGDNFVVIAVDGNRLVDGIPSVAIDWFNYGGLTRDVSLVEVPETFVDDFDLHLKPGTTNEVAGYVHVLDAPSGTPVRVSIPEAGIDTTAKTDAEGNANFSLLANKLALWSPESPKLYKVQIEAGADKLTDDIGFREIRVDGTKILLNGKPIFLRGINFQAEAPYRTGRVSTQQDVDNVFGFLKDLNANFVRLAHYPHDERMERTADRQGILIWSEIPLWQNIAFDQPGVYDKADTMLHEMIRRDRDKASVIFWSVANETSAKPVRTEFLRKLIVEARQLDSTRLITAALYGTSFKDNVATLNDPLMEYLDVVGINEYVGWYTMTPEQADSIRWELPQKPFVISEFGAEAKQGNHGSDDQRWTEEQQVNVLRHNFTMLAKIPQVRGYAPWILMDFRSPGRNIPLLQDGFNRKGLISEDGKKKQSFFLVRELYRGSPHKAD